MLPVLTCRASRHGSHRCQKRILIWSTMILDVCSLATERLLDLNRSLVCLVMTPIRRFLFKTLRQITLLVCRIVDFLVVWSGRWLNLKMAKRSHLGLLPKSNPWMSFVFPVKVWLTAGWFGGSRRLVLVRCVRAQICRFMPVKKVLVMCRMSSVVVAMIRIFLINYFCE